jgi:hypothetical protein
MMQGCRRGGRSKIKKRAYDRDHPRPVTDIVLTPWVAEQRERRNRRRDANKRKGTTMDRRYQQLGNAQERAYAEVALAAAMGNVAVQKLHDAFAQWWYPDVYCDFWDIPAAATVRQAFTFPGVVRLKRLLLMDPGGVYPSRLDVTIEKFTHRPFSLNQTKPELDNFAFRLLGGTDVIFTNADATNAATVYIEWEMVNLARPTVE